MIKKKSKRLRGSQTHGRGWRSSKHKGGSRGGVGNAGSKTHKRFSAILKAKKAVKDRKVTSIRDVESKLTRYIKKKFLVFKKTSKDSEKVLMPTAKFYAKYRKVLSQGQPSFKLVVNEARLKLSKAARAKFE